MKGMLLSTMLLAQVWWISGCKSPQVPVEPYRPAYHFTPPANWMNDPNGLVFCKGKYHLFYQYYPDSTVWGPMHWGHAESADLVSWKHLPIALYPDSLGYIFSGSAVCDTGNAAQLQSGSLPLIAAVFTYHDPIGEQAGRIDFQSQGLAFSADGGRTFQKYAANPVIANPGIRDFRDPKVFWHHESQQWVLVLAAGQQVMFYGSLDLKHWSLLSEFGSSHGSHGGVWECPDLFPLPHKDSLVWVLLVSINPGGPNGGSCTQYFTGKFNGRQFIASARPETVRWLDYGPDNYAGVTWSGVPASDGRRLFMGWMNNWTYAQQVPSKKWRGAMTLPRVITATETDSGLRLASYPVEELKRLRIGEVAMEIPERNSWRISGLNEILIELDLGASTARDMGFRFSGPLGDTVLAGYDKLLNRFYLRRDGCGNADFSPAFSQPVYAPRASVSRTLSLHVFIDRSSLELFADGGTTNLTALIFPSGNLEKLELISNGGDMAPVRGSLYTLREAPVEPE